MIRDKSYSAPFRRKRPRLRIRITRSWPLLLWLVAAAGAVVLYARNVKPVNVQGLVAPVEQVVAAVDTLRVDALLVQPGQVVKAGDAVVRMDSVLLDAQAAVDEARLIQAEAQALSEQHQILETLRRVDDAYAAAKADLQMEIINRDRDAALLAGLQKEQTRLESLAAKGLASDQELGVLRPQIAELMAASGAYPALISALEERLTQAGQSRSNMNRLLESGDSGSALDEARRRCDDILASLRSVRERWSRQREAYTLRAAIDGVVSTHYVQAGDVVPAGMGILRIVAPDSGRAVGFLPEPLCMELNAGERVTVVSSARRIRTSGVIAVVAPYVESVATQANQPLLDRLMGMSSQPLRVRRFVVSLASGHALLPGETVTIRPLRYTAWKGLLPEWLGNRKGGKE